MSGDSPVQQRTDQQPRAGPAQPAHSRQRAAASREPRQQPGPPPPPPPPPPSQRQEQQQEERRERPGPQDPQVQQNEPQGQQQQPDQRRLDSMTPPPNPGQQPHPLSERHEARQRAPPADAARNPFRAKCPDFRGFEWDERRQQLIDEGTVQDEDGAIAYMVAKWHERIEREKEAWRREHGADEAGDQGGRVRAEDVRKEPGSRASSPTFSEASGVAAEDTVPPTRKRKFLPIPVGKMGPDSVLQPPAPYAISKLRKVEYVELYYFTATARERAKREQLSFDENALALRQASDSVTLAPVLRGSPEARRDDELEWEEIMQARVQFMHWIEKLQWPEEYVRMFSLFFYNLETHDIRSQAGGTTVLVRYQARYRRDWHLELEQGRPFDLSAINPKAIEELKGDILHEKMVLSIRQV
ncbi:hypothetical protein BV20DRAFT_954603, partial [Pilatotrama ljubarskyi]